MLFATRRASYIFLLLWLERQRQNLRPEVYGRYHLTLRLAFENHVEHNRQVLSDVSKLASEISANKKMLAELKTIVNYFNKIDYKKVSSLAKFANPFGRAFESKMAVHFVQQPTSNILHVVKVVSKFIVGLLKELNKNEKYREKIEKDLLASTDFCLRTLREQSFARPGALTFTKLVEILEECKPENFGYILHIHYLFMRNIFRKVPLLTTCKIYLPAQVAEQVKMNYPHGINAVVADFKELPANEIVVFLDALKREDKIGNRARKFIIDGLISDSSFYQDGPKKRGRNDVVVLHTNQMGIMCPHQADFCSLPTPEGQVKYSDVASVIPNFSSPVVVDLMKYEAIPVAGPSGMFALLVGGMLTSGVFDNEDSMHLYVAAVLFYIVAGGYHSFPEVLGPAKYCLGLFADYQVQIPQLEKFGLAPNLHVFFEKIIKLDPEFAKRYDQLWLDLLKSWQKHYQIQYDIITSARRSEGLLPNIITVTDEIMIDYSDKFTQLLDKVTTVSVAQYILGQIRQVVTPDSEQDSVSSARHQITQLVLFKAQQRDFVDPDQEQKSNEEKFTPHDREFIEICWQHAKFLSVQQEGIYPVKGLIRLIYQYFGLSNYAIFFNNITYIRNHFIHENFALDVFRNFDSYIKILQRYGLVKNDYDSFKVFMDGATLITSAWRLELMALTIFRSKNVEDITHFRHYYKKSLRTNYFLYLLCSYDITYIKAVLKIYGKKKRHCDVIKIVRVLTNKEMLAFSQFLLQHAKVIFSDRKIWLLQAIINNLEQRKSNDAELLTYLAKLNNLLSLELKTELSSSSPLSSLQQGIPHIIFRPVIAPVSRQSGDGSILMISPVDVGTDSRVAIDANEVNQNKAGPELFANKSLGK